jgi:low temperature requirement protein LtrA
MPRTRLHVPMTGRAPDEPHRVATPLELFFDLVFVVAVARAAVTLHHAVAEGHPWHGALLFVMTFCGIWWAWVNFTWFASAYDTDDVGYRLLAFVQLVGALVFASAVGESFAESSYAVGVSGYVVMRVALLGQWLRVARQDRKHRGTALRYVAGIALVQLAWVLTIFTPQAWRVPLFFALFACELAVPWLAERHAPTPWHPHHIAERHGLFTIIVLGESVLAVSLGLQAITAAGRFSPALVPILAGGLLVLFSMWWLYFDSPPDALLLTPNGGFLYGYGHLVVLGSAAAVGAGIAVVADVATNHAHIGRMAAGYAVAVPVAVFLVSLWLLHLLAGTEGRTRSWAPVAVVLVLLTPLTGWPVFFTGLVLAGLIIAKLLVQVQRVSG